MGRTSLPVKNYERYMWKNSHAGRNRMGQLSQTWLNSISHDQTTSAYAGTQRLGLVMSQWSLAWQPLTDCSRSHDSLGRGLKPATATHTQTHTHSLSLSLTHTCMHTHALTHTLSLSHTRRHTHTLSLSLSLWKFSCIKFHSLIHASMYINDACNFIFTHL